jgi:hypothetical protein
MRLHIGLDDDLVAQLERALGSLADSGHDWDSDPAEWVRAARRGVGARIG